MYYFSFCVQFLSLSIMTSNQIHVIATDKISFFLAIIPLCIHTISSLHGPQIALDLGSCANAAIMWEQQFLLNALASFLFDVCQKQKLDYMVILFLIFGRLPRLFPIITIQICIHSNGVSRFSCSHVLATVCLSSF